MPTDPGCCSCPGAVHGVRRALLSRPPSGRAARRHGAQCRLGWLCQAVPSSLRPRREALRRAQVIRGWGAGGRAQRSQSVAKHAAKPTGRVPEGTAVGTVRLPAAKKAKASPLPGTQPGAPGGAGVAAARAG